MVGLHGQIVQLLALPALPGPDHSALPGIVRWFENPSATGVECPAPCPVEFPGKAPYDNYADEFVRPVAVTTPAGGEMSGLTAHFLFGANAVPPHTHNPGRNLRQQNG
jgi:hypothetical protein